MLTDDELRRLCDEVEERHHRYLTEWLEEPAFRAALHRYDKETTNADR